ncbi:MAG: cupin domain-containing protein [Ilumatobacteraceae bacterium]|nr:cupin domain-containing protein [Acidimicrobiales bacterium]MCB9392391.1 cupin domain-containing protein [Acidimicrobiaceae bacterium]
MKVVAGGDRSTVYGGRFTGQVELEMLNATPPEVDAGVDGPDTALVHFTDGAVTFWHSHPGGQQLFVVSGDARVGTEADGEVPLAPGTLVVCPVDEPHWHGAMPGCDTTLLTITWGTTRWTDRSPV